MRVLCMRSSFLRMQGPIAGKQTKKTKRSKSTFEKLRNMCCPLHSLDICAGFIRHAPELLCTIHSCTMYYVHQNHVPFTDIQFTMHTYTLYHILPYKHIEHDLLPGTSCGTHGIRVFSGQSRQVLHVPCNSTGHSTHRVRVVLGSASR